MPFSWVVLTKKEKTKGIEFFAFCTFSYRCMGCKISKEEEEDNETTNERSITTVATTNTMTSKIPAVDYKSRLEWKICLVGILML